MRLDLNDRAARVSGDLYRAMLLAYPSDFRRHFGPHMEQVFRTSSRETVKSKGLGGLLALWTETVADLVVTAAGERVSDRRKRMVLHRLAVAACASVPACIAGYLHLETDADGATILVVLLGAFGCGAVCPDKPWRWSLIIGAGIPLALLLGHHTIGSPVVRDHDTPPLFQLLPALLSGYAGALIGIHFERPQMPAVPLRPRR